MRLHRHIKTRRDPGSCAFQRPDLTARSSGRWHFGRLRLIVGPRAMPNPAEKTKTAITPRREDDFPEWYQQVIRAAELAESSDVRGCMVIRPWGFGIWENMQHQLDAMFRA